MPGLGATGKSLGQSTVAWRCQRGGDPGHVERGYEPGKDIHRVMRPQKQYHGDLEHAHAADVVEGENVLPPGT